MLPQKVFAIIKQFCDARDLEDRGGFHNDSQQVLDEAAHRGLIGGPTLVRLKERYAKRLADRGRFLVDTMERVIASSSLQTYSQLATDLKAFIQLDLRGQLAEAQRWLEKNRLLLKLEQIHPTARLESDYEAVLSRLNAEIDLLVTTCEKRELMRKEDKAMTGPTIVYNLHGDNPRVNINSQDYSINEKNSDALFTAMMGVIRTAIKDAELKGELEKKAGEMQTAIGNKSFAKRYAEFIALAANHMSILGPFIPALTQFLK